MAKTLGIESSLSDSEARLIEVLEDKTTQRNLARAAGFSLGMTNLLIKRLVKKGLIKVVTMNGRTLSYMLTPQGFAEKLKRSYDYVTASMRYIAQVRGRIRLIVAQTKHEPPIIVIGSGELAELAKETLREIGVDSVTYEGLDVLPQSNVNRLCLICQRELPESLPVGYLAWTLVP